MSRRPRDWSSDEEPRRQKYDAYISWSNVCVVAGAVIALLLLIENNGRALFHTSGGAHKTSPGPLVTRSLPRARHAVELDPWASQPEEDVYVGAVCPFERIPYSKLREYESIPYILGAEKQPGCKTCHQGGGLHDICHYKTVGELVCPVEDRIRMLDYLMTRADEGAPGYAEMLTMTPCDLFPLFQGRTLWLLGDSQMHELANTLGCFYREFHNNTYWTGSSSPHAAAWAKMIHSFCFVLVEETRICFLRMNYGQRIVEEVLPLLPSLGAKPSDIMLLNFGLHNNKVTEYEHQLSLFHKYFKRYKADMPFLIWRETSPQHFKTHTGEFTCSDCEPLEFPFICRAVQNVTLNLKNELEVSDPANDIVALGGWRNLMASKVMTRLGIPIMYIWNHSVPIWQFHHHLGSTAMHECTHSCHPSVYEVWLYLLYEVLKREQGNINEQESWST
eukprot:jgi/Botrbrau1/4651/Bobra.33_2s0022.1